jgi:hypothetical protein
MCGLEESAGVPWIDFMKSSFLFLGVQKTAVENDHEAETCFVSN